LADLLLACRFVHFSAAMLLFGISIFDGLLVPPELRDRFSRLAGATSNLLVAVIVLTAFLWFGLEAGLAGNGWADMLDPATLSAVATDTPFGQVWVWHIAIAVVLLGATLLRGELRRVTMVFGSAALLGSLGLVGHAAMQEGTIGWLHKGSHVLHLLSAGFWVGCLAPLLLCLFQLRLVSTREPAIVALRRFSGLGHVAVALALVTGVINTALTLGRWPIDFASPYQALLALKCGLVLIMIAIAIVNRYATLPRLEMDPTAKVRALVIGTASEIIIGAAVIGLVSVFATFDPV
jgi:putative copper resistance protein D